MVWLTGQTLRKWLQTARKSSAGNGGRNRRNSTTSPQHTAFLRQCAASAGSGWFRSVIECELWVLGKRQYSALLRTARTDSALLAARFPKRVGVGVGFRVKVKTIHLPV